MRTYRVVGTAHIDVSWSDDCEILAYVRLPEDVFDTPEAEVDITNILFPGDTSISVDFDTEITIPFDITDREELEDYIAGEIEKKIEEEAEFCIEFGEGYNLVSTYIDCVDVEIRKIEESRKC